MNSKSTDDMKSNLGEAGSHLKQAARDSGDAIKSAAGAAADELRLGKANVNIASMAVSRSRAEGGAVMAVTVDSPVAPEVVNEIRAIEGFDAVWFVDLDVG